MKWPLTSLATVLKQADVFVDGDWVESKDQNPDGDVRLIQLADVGDGFYIDKSSRFLTSAKAAELRCTFLAPGDVLVARMPDPLGRACIFPGDSKRSVTVVDVCIIRPTPQHQDARWLMHCFNAPAHLREHPQGVAADPAEQGTPPDAVPHERARARAHQPPDAGQACTWPRPERQVLRARPAAAHMRGLSDHRDRSRQIAGETDLDSARQRFNDRTWPCDLEVHDREQGNWSVAAALRLDRHLGGLSLRVPTPFG